MSRIYLKDKIKEEKKWGSLNSKQKDFCFSVLSGDNVFLTGPAGCGKSYVLNFLFNFLSKNKINYGKTAMSGIAALNIGGATIHSWSGVGLANTSMDDIFKNVFRNKKARNRIAAAEYLFIDEISLCSGRLLDILDKVYKGVRRNKSPFGGIKICVSGDFLQLPYIPDNSYDDECFAFESSSWKYANFKTVELKEIVRQKDDKEFAEILNKIRIGDISDISKIKERINFKFEEDIRPVRLLGYNKSVDSWNQKCLESLSGKVYTFTSKDTGESYHTDFFNKNCPSPQKLELKINCQVMLTYNIDVENGLVNGMMGKVTGIQDNLPVVKFINGNVAILSPEKWEIKEQYFNPKSQLIEYKSVASRSQIPLRLAYSSSYHKAQGTTLNYVEVDLNQVFAEGMAYSALSRVKSLNGLSIISDFDPSKMVANKKCIDFYKNTGKL